MPNGQHTDLVLLAISKAFDKVNHSQLIWKLHQYGIRGHALGWISAFLGNRSQSVVLAGLGEESDSVPFTSRHPPPTSPPPLPPPTHTQCSVLGPVLFIYMIQSLPTSVYLLTIRLFYLAIEGPDGGPSATDRPRQSVGVGVKTGHGFQPL